MTHTHWSRYIARVLYGGAALLLLLFIGLRLAASLLSYAGGSAALADVATARGVRADRSALEQRPVRAER